MSNKKQIEGIVEIMKTLDEADLQILEVMAERLALALAGDEAPAETEDQEIVVVDTDDEDPWGDDDGNEDNGNDEDPFNEEPADIDPDEDGENFFGSEDTAEDIFGDDEPEEPKPVGRRTRGNKEEEKKPAAKKPAPKKEPEPEFNMIDAPTPLVKLTNKDTELSTKNEMGKKLLSIGIKKDIIPDPRNANCLHRGLRFIFAKAYGNKALTLEQVTKKAHEAGYDLKFTKGNRGADLKVQAYVTMLLNEGVINWPSFD